MHGDHEEIIEILSSSPPRTPERVPKRKLASSDLFGSSPLFGFEKKLPKLQEIKHPAEVQFSPNEQVITVSSSPIKEDVFQLSDEPPAEPNEPPVELPVKQTNVEPAEPTVEPFVEQTLDTPIDTIKPAVKPAASRRPQFKSSANEAVSAGSKVAAVSKASDRKTVGDKLTARIWLDTGEWAQQIKDHFQSLQIFVECKPESAEDAPEGVSLIITAEGKFDDVWDDELNIFIRCEQRIEQLSTAIVCIEAQHLENLGKLSVEDRDFYFARVQSYVSSLGAGSDSVIYFFPDIAAHFRKCAEKFNRAMRRRVASGDHSRRASDPVAPPDEHFYFNLEAELQVLNDIEAFFPRNTKEAAEMIANCIIDLGVLRYHMHVDEVHDAAGAYVRSKSAPLDVTIEALTKIQGLPPRIAQKLGTEAQSLGRIRSLLGTNAEMRASRIKRFGQGTWNNSLLTFLEADDPDLII